MALQSLSVLGMRLDATSYQDAVERVCEWAMRGESRTVAVANVHSVMEAHDAASFREAINTSDLATPDGVPLVWLLKASGISSASRVYGPDLTVELLRAAEQRHLPVGFFGGTPKALDGLLATVGERFPGVRVAYACAPPFRALDAEEDERVIEDIRTSGVRILFVGLGCPKQELWMMAHRGVIPAVMLGVGAAFDFLSGMKRQAPNWMQRNGLEWVFRLMTEPRRLFWRYAVHNPRFIVLAGRQVWFERRKPALREFA